MTGAAVILLVAFDKRVFPVGIDAFRLVVLVRSVGVVDDFLRDQVHAAHLRALIAIGAEREFSFFRRSEVLRLEGALEREVAAVKNAFLVRQLRFALFVNDVGLLHSRTPRRQLVRVFDGNVGPGKVHPLARHGRALAALGAEGRGGFRQALVQDVEKTLHARVPGAGRIECRRAGKQHVAVRQIKRPSVTVMRIMRGQVADGFRFEINFQGVAEGLGEKENSPAVGRPVGPFAKRRQPGDVRRQMIGGTFAVFAGRRFGHGEADRREHGEEGQNDCFHRLKSARISRPAQLHSTAYKADVLNRNFLLGISLRTDRAPCYNRLHER